MRLSVSVLEDELKKAGCTFQKRPDIRSASCEDCERLAALVETSAGLDAKGLLLQIFLDYSQWETRMLTGIIEKKGIQKFIDTAAEKLVNPIALLDSEHRILAKSENYPREYTDTIWDEMKGEHFFMNQYYSMAEIKRFSEKLNHTAQKYVLYNSQKDPRHTYYASLIQIDGQTIGAIGTISLYGPLTQGQVDLLFQVKEYFQMYFKNQNQISTKQTDFEDSFAQLLSGNERAADMPGFQKELRRLHWKMGTAAVLLTFLCPVPFYSEMEKTLFMKRIRLQFPWALLTVREETIVAAVRISDIDSIEKKEMEKFLEDYDLYMGCSHPFCEFSGTAAAGVQSRFAAYMAQSSKRKRFLFYENCQIEHLLSEIKKGHDLRVFCNPSILRLWDSKKTSDHLLVDCLRVYLLNGRSLADTARMLKIHRNTVVYRIEKLEDLLKTDFHQLSEEQLFSYLLTCLILHYGKSSFPPETLQYR